jgi:hypothetical protein
MRGSARLLRRKPTTVNAARQLDREAARSGSPYRYRSKRVDGGSTVEKYDPRTGKTFSMGQQ